MGTYAENTKTSISLNLAKLREGYLNRTSEFKALMENVEKDWSDTFLEVCAALGSEIKVVGDYLRVVQVSEECKIGWQDNYFAALTPFAQDGDYAEFQCQEYGIWRYIRHGGKFIEQTGAVTVEYPPLPALAKAKRS